ncbi:MAG: hypothetical protein QNJ35_14295 [Paracoccaceae bacterium]|nr:hypothetical protein [Paracoccaceae bacterium]
MRTGRDGLVEELFIRDVPNLTLSVMTDHLHIFARRKDSERMNFHMAGWPIPLTSRRKPYNESMIPRHGRTADAVLPRVIRDSDTTTHKVWSIWKMFGVPTIIRR